MSKKNFHSIILIMILLSIFVLKITAATPAKDEVITTVLNAIQAGNLGLITSNLDPNIVLISGEEDLNTILSGEYEQISQALQFFITFFNYIDVSAIQVIDQSVEGDEIITQVIFDGSAENTSRTFKMEFVFTWEFTAKNKVKDLFIEFDSESINLLLNGQGNGHIVSRYLVSNESMLHYENYQNFKEYFKVATYEQLRDGFQEYPISSLPTDAIVTPTNLVNGYNGETYSLSASDSDKIIVYIHGGAYILGEVSTTRLFAYTIAKKTNVPVLSINYGLAPENPYPAAPGDCYAVYADLLNTYDPGDIVLIGESTGGGLVLAVTVLAMQNSIPLPGAIVAISPWADLTNSSASYTTKREKDAYLSSELLNNAAGHYLNGTPATNPVVSPVFASIAGFPPLYLTVSSWEVLYDDAAGIFSNVAANNVDVTIEIGRGMIHVWPAIVYVDHPDIPDQLPEIPEIPETESSNVNIANFILEALY